MIRQLLASSPLLGFPLAALAIFMITFTAVVVRVFTQKAQYDQDARLPLGTEEERHG